MNCKASIICNHEERKIGYCNLTQRLTCVASVSVWFRSKERPRNGAFGFGRARNGTRAKLWTKGEAKGKDNLSSPPPPRSFTLDILHAVFDSGSSLFAPKPHGNTCYAGYAKAGTVFFPGTRGYIGSLSKDFFERRTSTETEALFFSVCLDATKFVYLSVFTFIETICAKIWAKPLPKNAKKTTSGWCAPLKKRLCFNSWITSLKRTLKQITTKIRKLVNCPFFFLFRLSQSEWPSVSGHQTLDPISPTVASVRATSFPAFFHKVLSTCRCEDEFEVNSGRTLTRLCVH